MKKFAFALALITCVMTLASCSDPKPRDILDADGNAIATGYYDGDVLVYEEKLDSNGNLSKKTTYDDSERVEKEENYTFNVLSNVVEYEYTEKDDEYTKKTVLYNNKGTIVSVTELKYENGVPTKETVTVGTGDKVSDVTECTYVYNEDKTVTKTYTSNGKKIREVLEDGNGVVIYDHEIAEDGSSVKTFYEMGKVISKVENYTKEGKLLITIKNIYDEKGTITRSESYDANNALKDYSEYVYVDGSLKALYKYHADGSIHTSIIYDENGKATIHTGKYVPVN